MMSGNVPVQLFWMTLPMIAGIFSLTAFHLVDTFFVSGLGVHALAALGFITPVVLAVGAIALGMGMGTAAVVSRAVGRGERERVRVLIRDSLLMAVILVAAASMIGLWAMEPFFRLLGATEEMLPYIRQYMHVWFPFAFLMSLTMVSNHSLRATGDVFLTGMTMTLMSVLNALLDPLLILGGLGFPALGIQGAAVAAVIARGVVVGVCLYFLIVRCKLVALKMPTLRELFASWREILKTAVPSSATSIMTPLVTMFVMWMVARYGAEAVAGVGAGSRVLQFTFIIPVALGTVLVPFIGQNWGAREIDRAAGALRTSYRFSLYYSAFCTVLYLPLAQWIGSCFSSDEQVIWVLGAYVTILQALSCFTHVGVHSEFALNAMGRPLHALVLNILRTVVCNAGFAFVGQHFFGLWGIFFGQAAGSVVAGVAARFWAERFIRIQKQRAVFQDAAAKQALAQQLAPSAEPLPEPSPEQQALV